MIEQGIYFALGCIVTALLALAFAPLLWGRALRLTRQRLQLQVPLSMQEILAERDGLRAEFAVERLRLEQEMDRVRASKGADLAAIGRRDVAAAASGETIADLREATAASDEEIRRLRRDLADAEAQAGTLQIAIEDVDKRLARAARQATTTEEARRRLDEDVVAYRTTIAGLETKAMGLEMRLDDARRESSPREQSLADSMRGRLETAMAQARRHEASGLSLRRELDEARTRIRQLEMERSALPDEADDGGLRAGIHALGLAVATMTRAARAEHRPEPTVETAIRRAADAAPAEAG